MKITQKILQNIIKEEIKKVLEQKLDSEKVHGSKRFGGAAQADVGSTTALARDQKAEEEESEMDTIATALLTHAGKIAKIEEALKELGIDIS